MNLKAPQTNYKFAAAPTISFLSLPHYSSLTSLALPCVGRVLQALPVWVLFYRILNMLIKNN